MQLTDIQKQVLKEVADLETVPQGAVNIRVNGKAALRQSTDEIRIEPKTDKPGIDIIVAPHVKNKSVHIPVIMSESGLTDLVYNDFYIGEGADVLIIAGCGIDNCGGAESRHDGIHTFHLAKDSKVRYVEKHIGSGNGSGGRALNPVTDIRMEKNSAFQMETVQLGGVTDSVRSTTAQLDVGAKLTVTERILTDGAQKAITDFKISLNGDGSSVDVVSRSIARDNSLQEFRSHIIGKAECFGHVECDGIMIGNSIIRSTPTISAENINAELMHEATIGKIAGEQLIKLQTLGLDRGQAEAMIINGFLR